MHIKVLGSGCKNCDNLIENTKLALSLSGLQANVEKITDIDIIMQYGIIATPGLVVDGKVVSAGKVLKPKEIAKLFEAK